MLNFQVKFVQTDRWTDGQTDNGKTICPDLSMLEHKNMDTTANVITCYLTVASSVSHGEKKNSTRALQSAAYTAEEDCQ